MRVPRQPVSNLAFLPDLRPAHFLVALQLLALSAVAVAQSSPEPVFPPPGQAPYTLHVYSDLLQIPTLVLDRLGSPIPGIAPESFQIQIDGGPTFHPTAVHPEGNEPLAVALVLDASGAQRLLLADLIGKPGRPAPFALLPQDSLSVYAFDCDIVRSAFDTPAAPSAVHDGVTQALADPSLHTLNQPTKTCPKTKHLWDAVGDAANDLSEQPGRRIILVISDGKDGGSDTGLADLHALAHARSIAIFTTRAPDPDAYRNPTENPLIELSNNTGGLALSSAGRISERLDRLLRLLRSRYILQFPRPVNDQGGFHNLSVQVANLSVTVRAAGIAVPLRDDALMKDPSTVPTDTSKMPVIGTKKQPE